jgi:hypothetical protein
VRTSPQEPPVGCSHRNRRPRRVPSSALTSRYLKGSAKALRASVLSPQGFRTGVREIMLSGLTQGSHTCCTSLVVNISMMWMKKPGTILTCSARRTTPSATASVDQAGERNAASRIAFGGADRRAQHPCAESIPRSLSKDPLLTHRRDLVHHRLPGPAIDSPPPSLPASGGLRGRRRRVS